MTGSDVDDIWAKLKEENQVAKTSRTNKTFNKIWAKVATGGHLSEQQVKNPSSTTKKAETSPVENAISKRHSINVSGYESELTTIDKSEKFSDASRAQLYAGQPGGGVALKNKDVNMSPVQKDYLAEHPEQATIQRILSKAKETTSSDDLLQLVRHDLNIVINGNAFLEMHEALKRLSLIVENAPSEHLDGAAIDLGKPLLRCLVDKKSVRIREQAGQAIVSLLERVPDSAIELQGYIIPTVLERMYKSAPPESIAVDDVGRKDEGMDSRRCAPGGYASLHQTFGQYQRQQKTSREDGEDVLVRLMRIARLTTVGAGKAISAYVNDILTIVASATLDDYHVINIEASELAMAMLESMGFSPDSSHNIGGRGLSPAHLKFLSRGLVFWLCPLLSAKRSEVRIAAIKAITRCVLFYGHESILDMSAWRDPNMIPIKAFYGQDLKVNYFGKLSTDRNPRVRHSFLVMLGEWLIHLPEAKNDHEYRLLPYVLSATNDNTNTTIVTEKGKENQVVNIAEVAVTILARVGKQYECENEEEMKKLRTFSPEYLHPISCGAKHAASHSKEYVEEEFQYPFPFNAIRSFMPIDLELGYGCRVCVFACFKRLQHPIVKEMREWKPEICIGATELLRVCLIFCEDMIEDSLQRIMDAMVVALTSQMHENCDTAAIRRPMTSSQGGLNLSKASALILDCGYLIGKFVSSPGTWLQLLLSTLHTEDKSCTTTINVHDVILLSSVLLLLSRCIAGASVGNNNAKYCTHLNIKDDIMVVLDVLLACRYSNDTWLQRVYEDTFCSILRSISKVLDACKYESVDTDALELKVCFLYITCTSKLKENFTESVRENFEVFVRQMSSSRLEMLSRHRRKLASFLSPLRKSRNVDLDIECLRYIVVHGFRNHEHSQDFSNEEDLPKNTKKEEEVDLKRDIQSVLEIVQEAKEIDTKSASVITLIQSNLNKLLIQCSD